METWAAVEEAEGPSSPNRGFVFLSLQGPSNVRKEAEGAEQTLSTHRLGRDCSLCFCQPAVFKALVFIVFASPCFLGLLICLTPRDAPQPLRNRRESTRLPEAPSQRSCQARKLARRLLM